MAASLDVAVALVEAAVRGAAAGGGTRQVVAAAVAAAFRTAMDYLAEARQEHFARTPKLTSQERVMDHALKGGNMGKEDKFGGSAV